MRFDVISSVLTLFLSCFLVSTWAALKEGECEVCIKVLKRFSDQITDEDRKDAGKIGDRFRKFCKNLRGKEDTFCYFLGGSETSATGMLKLITAPLSYFKPVEKICEDLKKRDGQICELRYDKQIDFAKVDFKKLKVKDLKRILDDWGESAACKGCAEKSDFIRTIKELLPKYAPEAAKQRDEL